MGPKGVAVDKNGHIITADNKACCVFIFQSNGKLVTKFGARGTSDRHFAGTALYLVQISMIISSMILKDEPRTMPQDKWLGHAYRLCHI